MSDTSPAKRAKVSAAPAPNTATTAAIAAAVTGEPALLQNIISFVPASFSFDKNDAATAATQPTLVLTTIATLCRAIPGLSRVVGPTNEALWREMVLSQFNFATPGDTYNVEDWRSEWCDEDDDGLDDECDDPEYAAWHRHPKNGPHREWKRAHPRAKTPAGRERDAREPNAKSEDRDGGEDSDEFRPDNFLVDGLAHWPALRTYFKPVAYGFLEKIQRDRSLMATLWPDHEDAFSLLCDLLLLPHFHSNDKVSWETWSDGNRPVYPCPMDACLLGRFPTQIVGRGFAMLKFCGFAPYFWTVAEEPVSSRWSGFDAPLPPTECKQHALTEQTSATREAAGGTCPQKCDCRTIEENEEDEGEGGDEYEDGGCQWV